MIDSGPISNHIGFGTVDGETLVYVTIGGENVVKVYKPSEKTQLVATNRSGRCRTASGDRTTAAGSSSGSRTATRST